MININALFYGILMDVINHLSPDSILQKRESVFGIIGLKPSIIGMPFNPLAEANGN